MKCGVYLLKGTTGKFYLGSTDHLERRLAQHQAGLCPSSKRLGLPLELVTFKECSSLAEARLLERKLKTKKNSQIAEYYLRK